ncbi:MAG: iron ABC transporter permease, partial [Candidatus Brocadiia bacterium]
LMAVPAAWTAARTDAPLAKVFAFLAVAPLLIPSHIVVYSWMQLLREAGSDGQPLFSPYNAWFGSFVMACYYFPVLFYGAYAAFKSTDVAAEESALLFTSPWKTWRKVVLPMAFPYLAASFVLIFLLCFAEFGIPAMLTVNTFVGEVFVYISSFSNIPSAVALSVGIFAFIVLLGIPLFRYLPAKYFAGGGLQEKPRVHALGKWKVIATAFLVFVLTVTIIVPVGALVIRAFAFLGDSNDPGSHFAGLSYFREAVVSARTDLQTSFVVGFLAAVFCVIVAIPIARILTSGRPRRQYSLFVLAAIAFIVPGTVFAVGLIRIWNHAPPFFNDIYTSPAILFLAHAGRFLPLAVLIIAAGMRRVGKEGEFMAKLHGASDSRAFMDITLPQLSREFWLAIMAVLVFSLGELGATSLVSPAGHTTVSARLYILMHYGNEEKVSALCLITIALIVLPVVVFALLAGQKKRRV